MLTNRDAEINYAEKVVVYSVLGFEDVVGMLVSRNQETEYWQVAVGNAIVSLPRERFRFIGLSRSRPFSIRQIASLAFGRGACDIQPVMELADFLGEPLRPVEAHMAYEKPLKAYYFWLQDIDDTDAKHFNYSIGQVEHAIGRETLVIPERILCA